MDFDQEYLKSKVMKSGDDPLEMRVDSDGVARYYIPEEEPMLPEVVVEEPAQAATTPMPAPQKKAAVKPAQQGQMELGFPVSGVNAKIRDAQNQLYSTGEIKAVDQTTREKIARFLQSGFEGLGMDRSKARNRAESLIGGDSSNLPLGMGVADFVPLLGTLLQTEEAAIMGGEAIESAKRGEIKQAALEAGGAVLGLLPGGVATAKLGKKVAPKIAESLGPTVNKMTEDYLTKTGAILKVAPDAPAINIPAAPKTNTPAFKNWFANSKVVDDKGNPAVWYHGSLKEFDEFKKPSSSSAIFFSPQADFASSFANISKGNVLPVYLKALNPFDYDNPKHREAVIKLAIENTPIYKNAPDQAGMRRVLEESLTSKDTGNWTTIEEKGFQDAIKSLGFDSFYVKERGVKNIGVYKPEQIKSVFNKGTFDPKDPRILYGGGIAGASTMQQEKK